jgi:hypothetical protein
VKFKVLDGDIYLDIVNINICSIAPAELALRARVKAIPNREKFS